MTKYSLFWSCSTTPASSIASTKNLEEPSIIGGSALFISKIALSISIPTNAANKCSQVWILTPNFSNVVPLSVVVT